MTKNTVSVTRFKKSDRENKYKMLFQEKLLWKWEELLNNLSFERMAWGQAWWLTPVIQHFGRPRKADHGRSGVQYQPDQPGETPSLLKIRNKPGMVAHACDPSYSGGWDWWITWARQGDVGVRWDHATALQPEWWEQNSISKNKKSTWINIAYVHCLRW